VSGREKELTNDYAHDHDEQEKKMNNNIIICDKNPLRPKVREH